MNKSDYLVQTTNGSYLIENQGPVYSEEAAASKTREISNALVDELVTLRRSKHMTQQEVADIIGMPRANVSRIERKLYTPTIGLLMKYANSLGKTLKIEMVDPEEKPE